jgi:hypothetical protein
VCRLRVLFTHPSAVGSVADNWVPDVRQVHSYLVSSAGEELELNKRIFSIPLPHTADRAGSLASLVAVGLDSHKLSLESMTADGFVYLDLILRHVPAIIYTSLLALLEQYTPIYLLFLLSSCATYPCTIAR